MRLKTEFIKLPLIFDVHRLQQEIDAFDETDWCPHPQGFKGNSALLLISANGNATDDGMKGPMLPTPLLEKSPYLKQVLASFGTVFGRTRLMRLDGNYEANLHMDASYYWQQRMRVHVPIQTHPEVEFICADKKVHMAAGESWIFDTWKKHNVINPVNKTRIHLVADTVGSARFQRLIDQAWCPFAQVQETEASEFIAFDKGKDTFLQTEKVNFPIIMSPWEQESLLHPMLEELRIQDNEDSKELLSLVKMFMLRWKATWHTYGTEKESEPYFLQTLEIFEGLLDQLSGAVFFENKMEAVGLIKHAVFHSAINSELRTVYSQQKQNKAHHSAMIEVVKNSNIRHRTPVFGEAIIIVAAPRSGSTLLFETLAQSPDLYSIGGESHHIIESIESLTPQANDFSSNVLTEKHAKSDVVAQIRQGFMHSLFDRDGNTIKANIPPIKMLEKTPKNALRIPFLKAVFPHAKFIYLYRNPRENISSIIDAWHSGNFVTYKNLPERQSPWSLLLVPGWKNLPENDIPLIAATQWQKAHETMMEDLKDYDMEKLLCVKYEDLLLDPQAVIENICQFAKIAWDKKLDKTLPLSKHTLTKPNPDKWKKNEKELRRVLPLIKETQRKAEEFLNNQGKLM